MAVERWTDEMLDRLGSNISELYGTASEMQGSISELRETVADMREGITDMRESINRLNATSQVLLQVAGQNQRHIQKLEEDMELHKQEWQEEQKLWRQKQAENDERFNVLLEEVRFLIRSQNKNLDNE